MREHRANLLPPDAEHRAQSQPRMHPASATALVRRRAATRHVSPRSGALPSRRSPASSSNRSRAPGISARPSFARATPLLCTIMLLLPLLAALPLALAADPLRVFHRVWHPALPSQPFLLRGTLDLAAPSLAPAPGLDAGLADFWQAVRALEADADAAVYQVALEHPGAADPALWAISSVRAVRPRCSCARAWGGPGRPPPIHAPHCHLPQATEAEIRVHLAPDRAAYALDYFVAPVPHGGDCPRRGRARGQAAGADTDVARHAANTSVTLIAPSFPPLPLLRTPPPLAADGKPVEAAPEKTFLQKYWIYFAIALVAILISPAGEEEGAGSGGASAGRR
ncbi:hypothetical protein WOLCODRAFT_151267 [Wolfiporia cocos MD-104 SS10]|uniref:ER membrane protein complex subunit 10 n=1 Tax=Wolfiporia cocos (strain MD-104) TaxID=742152 RepID=A0A2H3JWX4_WOLCO|nr:hypothetical protein WOLCODRAFT_151267 [Wolfiporia cocos MD-104 SS10]